MNACPFKRGDRVWVSDFGVNVWVEGVFVDYRPESDYPYVVFTWNPSDESDRLYVARKKRPCNWQSCMFDDEYNKGDVKMKERKFKFGDKVRVSDDNDVPGEKAIFLGYAGEDAEYPYIVDADSGSRTIESGHYSMWKHCAHDRPEIAKDTLVWVRNRNNPRWRPQYAKEFGKDGRIRCYLNGRTSHTSPLRQSTRPWDEYSLTHPNAAPWDE